MKVGQTPWHPTVRQKEHITKHHKTMTVAELTVSVNKRFYLDISTKQIDYRMREWGLTPFVKTTPVKVPDSEWNKLLCRAW